MHHLTCLGRRLCLLAGIFTTLFCLINAQGAPTFHINTSQLEIAVPAGVNHLPLSVPVVAGSTNLNLTNVTVTSDSSWVAPTVDRTNNVIALTFSTTGLVAASSTATITVSDGANSEQFFVKAGVSVVNVVGLVDDPVRSRTYAIHQNALNLGSLIVFDPIQGTTLGCLTVGQKPTDLAIKADGSEMLVICSASKSISAINLQAQKVSETIALSTYGEGTQTETSANVEYGPGNIIYYTDGSGAPALRVLNRATSVVVQSIYFNGTAYDSYGNTTFGFGDIAVLSDKSAMYGWAQYGWNAGNAGSSGGKFTVNSNGTVTVAETTQVPTYPTGMARDPLDTPALISRDGSKVFLKQYVFNASAFGAPIKAFPAPIYAISPNAEVVSTSSAIYEYSTGNKLYTLPVTATVQAYTSDYSRLVYFDATAKQLKTINLLQVVGPEKLGIQATPANGAIVQVPAKLQWTPLTGVDSYNVYLGTSTSAVGAAGTNSAEYLGQVTGSQINLSQTLTAGTTYYWRVDSVNGTDVTTGTVYSFTVSAIASSVPSINATTISAHDNYSVPVSLSSATAGLAWTASSANSWISFVSNTGTTPATLQVRLDATKAAVGVNQGSVTVTYTGGTFSIPVSLQVDALTLTVMRSDPGSTKVYAISEATDANGGTTRAYLLEIDTLLRKVTRVVTVGSSAVDLAIHHPDNRIYVPNWKLGGLLAVNLTTFLVERTYPTLPFGSVGSSAGDVFRVSAGTTGRIMVEEEDQWIDVSLLNTTSGAVLATGPYPQRQGSGEFEPSGRYYYHGDDNISNASMHKMDCAGDVITQVKAVQIAGFSYYGTRNVVISEDGKRIFWNGGVFDPDLNVEWLTATEIFSCNSDGRYAFSETSIFDLQTKQIIAPMPVSTKVSAFNSATGRLVVQNGSALGYYTLFSDSLLGDSLNPKNGSIVQAPTQLQWKTLPGVSSYKVYLGAAQNSVATATSSSPEYLGETTTSAYALSSTLEAGNTYYWRVDLLIDGVVVDSQIQSFTVSNVAPGNTELSGATVQGYDNCLLTTALSSATTGLAWTASSSDSWISFVNTSGTTPATLQVKLNATNLLPGINNGSITVTSGGSSFTLPVKLQVDALALTVMKTDAGSAKIYAISEATVTSGSSRAYLLEIDCSQEKITRVMPVGTSATDLAIHHGDNRIYVPNWKPGGLQAVNLTTFQVDKIISTPPYGSYNTTDVYRVAAGTAGRVIVESEDQWITVSLLNTSTGSTIAKASSSHYEGGGAFDPTGRYYYRYGSISSTSLEKFDLAGDVFTTLNSAALPTGSTYGPRGLILSEDGTRIITNGAVLDTSFGTVWVIGDPIYSTSANGRYAFGETKIYDTTQKVQILSMPLSTKISAYNTTSQKLLVQNGSKLLFSQIGSTITFTAPVLSFVSATSTSITVGWTDNNLEVGFTLQMRLQGATNWTDVTPTISANTTSKTVTGLTINSTYEFRIKADSPVANSPWSNILAAPTELVYTGAQTRNVTDVATLTTALNQAANNPSATFTINLAAGRYTLGGTALPNISGTNTTIKGPTTETATIDGASLSGGVIFNITGSGAYISSIDFANAAVHAIAIQSGANNGYIVSCGFYSYSNTAAIYGTDCSGWSIYGNSIEGIAGTTSTAQPAIYFRYYASNTEIAYNLILDCDRGIGVGNSSYDYISNLWVFNNMIADVRSSSFPGAGIEINYVSNGFIENNTLYQTGSNSNAIEYKYSNNATIQNNLTNKPITGSSSSSAILATNNTSAVAAWFKNPLSCDLRLASSIANVVDVGTKITDITRDIEGDTRPAGNAYDIGADEYIASASSSSSSSSSGGSSSSSSSSSGGGGGAPSYWYFIAVLLLGISRRQTGKTAHR